MNQSKFFFGLPLLLLLLVMMLAPAPDSRHTAKACWNTVLIECFDRSFGSFPWENPPGSGRRWRSASNSTVYFWGIENVVYSPLWSAACNNDEQACWIIGGSGNEDPDFNWYPSGLQDYITYGPFDLSAAEDAIVQFQLYCASELNGDSIFWGVANNFNLANATVVLLDSAFSGTTWEQLGTPWPTITANLGELHDLDGNDASALGMQQLWAFWFFSANSNSVSHPPTGPLHNGAFVDNVLIQWDDGGIDMSLGGVSLVHPDSIPIAPSDIVVTGDSVCMQFIWTTCAGLVEEFPDVHVLVYVRDPLSVETVLLDTVVQNVPADTIYTWVTPAFTFERDDRHTFYVEIDPDDEIPETRENNNNSAATIDISPPNPHPEFTWINPGTLSGDTVFTDSLVMLRWECYDIAEDASISLYFDNNDNGCTGAVIPGGNNLLEHDGPDSLLWNVYNLFPGTVRFPFVLLHDAAWDTCIYAPFPVKRIATSAVTEPVGVATEFSLAQNYPNPFNPQTEISYGITQAGRVTLKVYDLLGREVSELVNHDLAPGAYTVTFNAHDLPSGVYLYSLTAPEGTQHRKMILMK